MLGQRFKVHFSLHVRNESLKILRWNSTQTTPTNRKPHNPDTTETVRQARTRKSVWPGEREKSPRRGSSLFCSRHFSASMYRHTYPSATRAAVDERPPFATPRQMARLEKLAIRRIDDRWRGRRASEKVVRGGTFIFLRPGSTPSRHVAWPPRRNRHTRGGSLCGVCQKSDGVAGFMSRQKGACRVIAWCCGVQVFFFCVWGAQQLWFAGWELGGVMEYWRFVMIF